MTECKPTMEAQAPDRQWVTPCFEQILLKDALASGQSFQPLDVGFYSS
jgi:hypothetical protein